MSERNAGLTADTLFVGVTRPPMRWGVAFPALLFNLVFTMLVFVLTKNLLTLLLAVPIHGICALLCARDARFFDLILLLGRTRLPALLANYRFWKASSYSPLALNLPDIRGRKAARPRAHARVALEAICRHVVGHVMSLREVKRARLDQLARDSHGIVITTVRRNASLPGINHLDAAQLEIRDVARRYGEPP